MRLLLDLAVTHIIGRGRQTLVAILGTALGVGFSIAMAALMQGGEDDFVAQLIDTMPHVQITDERRTAARQPADGPLELEAAPLGEVLDGGDDQVVLGREVVELRAPADSCPLGDQGGRRTAEAALDEAVDGRVEQPGPHRPGPLLLRHARRRAALACHHPVRMSWAPTNSQA